MRNMDAMSTRLELGATRNQRSAEQLRGQDTTPSRQIKCHTMQSNRRSDNRAPRSTVSRAWEINRRPERVRISGRAEGSLVQIKCHTMQSNCPPNLLKTNDRHPNKVTHFFEPAVTSQASGGGPQRQHAA